MEIHLGSLSSTKVEAANPYTILWAAYITESKHPDEVADLLESATGHMHAGSKVVNMSFDDGGWLFAIYEGLDYKDDDKGIIAAAEAWLGKKITAAIKRGQGMLGKSKGLWVIFDHYEETPIVLDDQADAEKRWEARDVGKFPYEVLENGKAKIVEWRSSAAAAAAAAVR